MKIQFLKLFKNQGILAGIVAAISFGFVNLLTESSINNELSAGYYSHFYLIFFRAIFLFPISAITCFIFHKRSFEEARIVLTHSRGALFFLILLATFSIFLTQIALSFSSSQLGGEFTTYIFYIFPLFIPFLSRHILGYHIYWYHYIAAFFFFIFIISPFRSEPILSILTLIPILSGMFYAVYIVVGEKLCQTIHPLTLSLILFFLVFVLSLSFCIFFFPWHQDWTLSELSFKWHSVGTAIFSAIGYMFGIIALRYVGANMTALLGTFTPLMVYLVTLPTTTSYLENGLFVLLIPILALPLLGNDFFHHQIPKTIRSNEETSNNLSTETLDDAKNVLYIYMPSDDTFNAFFNPLKKAAKLGNVEIEITLKTLSPDKHYMVIGTLGDLLNFKENISHQELDKVLSFLYLCETEQEIKKGIKEGFDFFCQIDNKCDIFSLWRLAFILKLGLWQKMLKVTLPKVFLLTLGWDLPFSYSKFHLSDNFLYVLACDMRNFTSLSENLSLIELHSFISKFQNALAPSVRKNGGFVMQYTGDGFLAAFDSAHQCLTAAQEMRHALIDFNKINNIKVRIGLGMDAGEAILCTLGEPGRWDLTFLSDAISIAATIEGLSKIYHANIIATNEFVSRLSQESKEIATFSFLDVTKLKGRKQAIKLFKITFLTRQLKESGSN